jgi:hypothetical protein
VAGTQYFQALRQRAVVVAQDGAEVLARLLMALLEVLAGVAAQAKTVSVPTAQVVRVTPHLLAQVKVTMAAVD